MSIRAMVSILVILATRAFAVDVTTCGQEVPHGEIGTLVADLDCSSAAAGSSAVVLGSRGTLAMGGHRIVPPVDGMGVYCDDQTACAISGPGEISNGPGAIGIWTEGNFTVTDVSLHDLRIGVGAYFARRSKLVNVSANNNTEFGVLGPGHLKATSLVMNDNGWTGILCYGRMRIMLDGFTAHGNGAVSNQFGGAIYNYGGASLSNSVVTGNKYQGMDVDLIVGRRPRLVASVCDHSAVVTTYGVHPDWAVCTLD